MQSYGGAVGGLSNLYSLLSTGELQCQQLTLPPATKWPGMEAVSKLSGVMQKIVSRCL